MAKVMLIGITKELKGYLEDKRCGPVSVKSDTYHRPRKRHPVARSRIFKTGITGSQTIEIFRKGMRLYWRKPIGDHALRARKIAIEFLESRGIQERERIY